MSDKVGARLVWHQAKIICFKDLKSEIRNRAAFNAVLLFTVCTLIVVVYAIGNQQLPPQVKASLIWVILFFASFAGLGHVFQIEADTGTSKTLSLHAMPEAIFIGKLLFNLIGAAGITLLTLPAFAIMLHLEIFDFLGLILVFVTGMTALATGGTVTAAVIARAGGKGALFGAIGFPILMPVLLMSVQGTKMVLDNVGQSVWKIGIGLLLFAIMLLTAAINVFPLIWDD